jgi:hypothetical protein
MAIQFVGKDNATARRNPPIFVEPLFSEDQTDAARSTERSG